jgi:hypothetical protein
MFKNRYRTNQLTVETMTRRRSSKVVIFIVNVKLVEKKEKSHVGTVKVRNPMSQNRKDGTIVNMPRTRPPSILNVDRLTDKLTAGVDAVPFGASELTTSATLDAVAARLATLLLAAATTVVPSIMHVGCSVAQ